MILESTISGIPCQIKVVSYEEVKGSYSYDAPSDLDYYGYTEVQYEVLDRKGYPALWLERKLTKREDVRIKDEIVAAHGNSLDWQDCDGWRE